MWVISILRGQIFGVCSIHSRDFVPSPLSTNCLQQPMTVISRAPAGAGTHWQPLGGQDSILSSCFWVQGKGHPII